MIGKKRTSKSSNDGTQVIKHVHSEHEGRAKRQCRKEKEKLKKQSDEDDQKFEEENEESKHFLTEQEDDEWKFDDEELRELLQLKTSYYMKTYAEVKKDLDFKEYPLNKYSKEQVSNIIKKERAKIYKEGKQQSQSGKVQKQSQIGGKSSTAVIERDIKPQKSHKRHKVDKEPPMSQSKYQMARFLINNFTTFEEQIQIEVFDSISTLINSNKSLQSIIQQQMMKQYSMEAKGFYEKRDFKSLSTLLSTVDPMMAILINIQISLTNQNYTEESSTLSETLLPFINKTIDYSFLSEDSSYIMSRFIRSLSNHIIDTHCQINNGYIICSLQYEPSRLKHIIDQHTNNLILQSALVSLNFPQDIASFISLNYARLLWPLLLNSLRGLTDKVALECLKVLSKLSLLSDPGPHFLQLVDIFASRQLIVDELLKVDSITIGLQALIRVIEVLLPQSKESIISILSQDSSKWEVLSLQNKNKADVIQEEIKSPDYNDIYDTLIVKADNKIGIDSLQELSRNISSEIGIYKHCNYQSCIAAAIISHSHPHIIATVPTGSGKTWIQGLIAKYYCLQNQPVTIVEPNKSLKVQTAEKLGIVDFGITILSIDEYYQYGTKDKIVILNEYDMIVEQNPYSQYDGCLSGLWNLRGNKVIAFSATSSIGHERLFNSCIGKPFVLNFKSEYEINQGISPIQEPRLVICPNNEPNHFFVIRDIELNYDMKPIVVIYEGKLVDKYVEQLKIHNFKYAQDASESTLEEIQTWDTGVLLLDKSLSRGLDTRFRVDSLVLIACDVKNYNELLQMVGRSSRQRSVCESIYYQAKQETNSQWIQRLKRQGMEELQDLERLMVLLEKKKEDSLLIKCLLSAKQKGVEVKCLDDLQKLITSAQFTKLTKGVFQ